jgi:hypothetical protein
MKNGIRVVFSFILIFSFIIGSLSILPTLSYAQDNSSQIANDIKNKNADADNATNEIANKIDLKEIIKSLTPYLTKAGARFGEEYMPPEGEKVTAKILQSEITPPPYVKGKPGKLGMGDISMPPSVVSKGYYAKPGISTPSPTVSKGYYYTKPGIPMPPTAGYRGEISGARTTHITPPPTTNRTALFTPTSQSRVSMPPSNKTTVSPITTPSGGKYPLYIPPAVSSSNVFAGAGLDQISFLKGSSGDIKDIGNKIYETGISIFKVVSEHNEIIYMLIILFIAAMIGSKAGWQLGVISASVLSCILAAINTDLMPTFIVGIIIIISAALLATGASKSISG